MSGAGINPLALVAPDLYTKQIAIQRRQALAQALLEQGGADPGKAAYGGLRNAGNAILGAFLAKRADKDMAGLYAPPPDPSQQDLQSQTIQQRYGMSPSQASGIMNTPVPLSQQAQPEPQISNNPGSGPFMPQPQQAQAAQQQPQAPQQAPQYVPQGQPRSIPQAMSGLIPQLPGMTQMQSFLAYSQSPQAYFTALAAANAPTPEQKNVNAAYGAGSQGAQQALQGEITKAGSVEVRPEGYVIGPGGKITYGPNEGSNVYYTTGPNNEPIAHAIQGGAEAAAQAAGARKGAEEQNTIIMVKLADGREVPMYAGAAAMQAGGGPPPGLNFPMPALPRIAGAHPPAAQNGTGPRAPLGIGQSAAQAKVNEAAGDTAAGFAKAKAVTDSTLKAIDGLIALNDQVPDSTGISPEYKADINARVPGLFKGDSGALAQWNQLNGIGVLGGLKQLQGLGRLDLPEVNQVVKTNGVPSDVPRAQRLQILQNLRTMVMNNLAASQNNLANLNQPGITTSTKTSGMQSYGHPGAQDIVDELRRRGVVK